MARITYLCTAKRQHAHDAHYQCTACGFASPVRCWAEGTYTARSSTNDQEWLARNAHEGAEMRARNAAVQQYERAWCPRCGQRSSPDIKRLQRQATTGYISAAIAGALAVASAIGFAMQDFTGLLSLPLAVCAITAPLFLVQALKHASSSRAKVIGVPQHFVQFAAAPPQAQPGYAMQAGQR